LAAPEFQGFLEPKREDIVFLGIFVSFLLELVGKADFRFETMLFG